jgi:hypothetical protein
MKPKKTIATFCIEELPNIIQLLTPAIVLSVVALNNFIGGVLIGAFLGLTLTYLDVRYERYFNKTTHHPHYKRAVGIFIFLVGLLMVGAQLLIRQ